MRNPQILVGLDRLAYPRYRLTATTPVFANRAALDAYEAALRTEADLVGVLETVGGGASTSGLSSASRTQGRLFPAARSATPRPGAPAPPEDDAAIPAAARRVEPEVALNLCSAAVEAWHAAASAAWATTPPVPPPDADTAAGAYFLRRYTAPWVLTRAAATAAAIYERYHRYADAVQLYRELLGQDRWMVGSRYVPCTAWRLATHTVGGHSRCRLGVHASRAGTRGAWWDRLALDVDHHLKDRAGAVEVCVAGLRDPHVRTGHRWALEKRLRRLAKQGHGTTLAVLPLPPPRPAPPERTIKAHLVSGAVVGLHAEFLSRTGVPCRVELAALEAYQHDPALGGPAWAGLHAENATVATLFGVLFWDVLFDAHPDVFQTPYQGAAHGDCVERRGRRRS